MKNIGQHFPIPASKLNKIAELAELEASRKQN